METKVEVATSLPETLAEIIHDMKKYVEFILLVTEQNTTVSYSYFVNLLFFKSDKRSNNKRENLSDMPVFQDPVYMCIEIENKTYRP